MERSLKKTERSFTFFFCKICNVCMTYEEWKRTQRSEHSFYKKQKRMQRLEHSFIKNRKERKNRNVLLKRTDAQPCFIMIVYSTVLSQC